MRTRPGKALAKLKWMVNVNLFDNETGSFWKGPGMDPKDVQTEVFLLPAASSVEKEGSLSNSGRWAQWRYKAIEPIGQSKPDSDIMNELYFRVKSLYQKQGGKFPEPIVNLTWNYGEKDANGKVKEVNIHNVAKEINGYYLEDVYDKTATPPKLLGKKGELCASFVHLQADGSTSSGCWIYSQSYTQKEGKIINMMARRGKNDPTGLGMYPEWCLGLAGEQADHLQPRLGGSERQTVGPETRGHQMGRGQARSGDEETRDLGRRRAGWSGPAHGNGKRQTALYHDGHRRGRPLRARACRRPLPRAL